MAERPLACAAWQPTLAGWLTAQLPPEEEAQLVAHLEGCAACRAEADSLMHVAALTLGADAGARATGDVPPVSFGEGVVAWCARERRARIAARMAVAMSAAAAAVVVGVVVTRDAGEPPLRGEPVSFVRQARGVEAMAVVAPEESGSIMELHVSGLDPDTTYSMWLTPPGGEWNDRVAAGTFKPDEDGEVEVRLRCALPAEEMGRAWATGSDGEIALDTEPA
jgi:hypothetical protein